mmetsp:Transcript_12421/g.34233  ORF Transcript_12421/g.34233 Transcript_12421/m.34233 type:complete len:256 (-) Transcript_12421:124-891(-)
MARQRDDLVGHVLLLDSFFQSQCEEDVAELGHAVSCPAIVHSEANEHREEDPVDDNVLAEDAVGVRRFLHAVPVECGTHEVVEHGGVVDNAGLTVRLDELVPKELREEEVGQMVGLELNVVAVLGLDQLLCHDAGVVEQQIEAIVLGVEFLGERPNGGEVHVVHADDVDHRTLVQIHDLGLGMRRLLFVAAGHDDGAVLGGQGGGRPEAGTAVGTRDDGDLARHVGDVVLDPGVVMDVGDGETVICFVGSRHSVM